MTARVLCCLGVVVALGRGALGCAPPARAAVASDGTVRDTAAHPLTVFDAVEQDALSADAVEQDALSADASIVDAGVDSGLAALPLRPRMPRAEPPRLGPVRLAGCPVPPRPRGPRPPRPPRYRPPRIVREDALPPPVAPAPRTAPLTALQGSGVWIWRARLCEGGDPAAIVARASRAGMRQIWVRVGDSRDGFYGAAVLEGLVARAHAAGIAVIGWGFPYLFDPAADAAWTRAALEWRGTDGSGIDGFSPDIETRSEGTRLTARRAVLYLSLVRPAAARTHRPLIATVFRPTAHWLAVYPYQEMAPYIDAFVPMVYWGCTEPGSAGVAAVRALRRLAPVHVLGQGYDMGEEGPGRAALPSGAEIARFCDASRRAGAVGASLWHWQSMNDEEWTALGECWWPRPRASRP